jgi:hypothetical protein
MREVNHDQRRDDQLRPVPGGTCRGTTSVEQRRPGSIAETNVVDAIPAY